MVEVPVACDFLLELPDVFNKECDENKYCLRQPQVSNNDRIRILSFREGRGLFPVDTKEIINSIPHQTEWRVLGELGFVPGNLSRGVLDREECLH